MRCIAWQRGGCPYRRRYGCTQEDRLEGLRLGQCVIELAERERVGSALRAHLEQRLPPEDTRAAVHALELFLDALVYRDRALAYAGVIMDMDPDWMDSDRYWRAVSRYRAAGSERLWRRYGELHRFLEDANQVVEAQAARSRAS